MSKLDATILRSDEMRPLLGEQIDDLPHRHLPNQDNSLLAQHDGYFSTVLADSAKLIEEAHALRFQVYCLERKFEHAEEHPDGLEVDAYDGHSIQGVLFHRPTRGAMGAVRMILPKAGVEDSFPIMPLLRASSLDLSDYIDIPRSIEVSRFAISKEFRRAESDQTNASVLMHASAGETNLAFLSLLQFVLRESVKHNVLFWTAVMEPKFLRLLARMGICYTPIGPKVVHHGIRQPCYCYLPEMLESVRRIQPQCWEVLTDGGVLHQELATNIGEEVEVRVPGCEQEDRIGRVPSGPLLCPRGTASHSLQRQ